MHKLKFLFLPIIFLCFSVAIFAQEAEEPNYHIYSIYFGGGNYFIDQEQILGLENWLIEVGALDNQQISVHAHTDNIGSKEYNDWLSQMRNRAAIQQLLIRNVPAERISTESFGELNPIYDNSTLEGRLKNRRVDIIIKPVVL
ncbi:MAG: OmpA family protein [Saprospiraceae bacterium]